MSSALLLSLLLAASRSAAASAPPATAPPATESSAKPSLGQAAREAVEVGGHEALTGLEHHAEEADNPAAIVMEHITDVPLGHVRVGGLDLGPTKHLVYIGVTVLVMLVVLRVALRGYARGGVPTGLAAFVELLLVFIRDEIAEKNIGHEGRKYTPLLASFFFFILIAALIGLLPKASTATGNPFRGSSRLPNRSPSSPPSGRASGSSASSTTTRG